MKTLRDSFKDLFLHTNYQRYRKYLELKIKRAFWQLVDQDRLQTKGKLLAFREKLNLKSQLQTWTVMNDWRYARAWLYHELIDSADVNKNDRKYG